MMVVSVLAGIIYTTNIHHYITRGESTRVSRPNKACRARSTDPPIRTNEFQNKGQGVEVCMERKIGISDVNISFADGRITHESAQTSRFCEAGRPQGLRRNEKCRYGYRLEVLQCVLAFGVSLLVQPWWLRCKSTNDSKACQLERLETPGSVFLKLNEGSYSIRFSWTPSRMQIAMPGLVVL